jgi:SAM-dependent methyltransferase
MGNEQENTGLVSQTYSCPRTGVDLVNNGSSLESLDRAISYEVHHGIPQFLNFPPVEDPNSNETLATLNKVAAEEGWRAAFEHASELEYAPEFERYSTDQSRSIFLDLLPLAPQSVVLEIGTGLGQFTSLIAEKVKRVYGLEVVPGQAEFTAERCRQDGRTNVEIACGGDDCRLPYPSGSDGRGGVESCV